jgi:tetratricopeptide (TPR) repeat protein
MKQRGWLFAWLVLACVLWALPALAQSTGSVKGVCRDADGKPIVGAVVQYKSDDTGRTYTIKTNNKGEYFSLGISPGSYKVTLLQDGKEVFHLNGVRVGLDELDMDIDLKKEQEQAAKGQGISPEQLKQMQEQQAKQQQEVGTVKMLNEKLAAAKQASDAGDFDTAISTLTEATQMDANRDLLWAKLADAYAGSAAKQTDLAEKSKRYGEAAEEYQKAIDLKQKSPGTGQSGLDLAHYYNNMAQALARSGKVDDAIKAYEQAAQLDPPGAGQYEYNIGAVLTNAGRTDEAIVAFDKAIAADPNRADAYYQKGVNLIAKATLDKNGKVVAAPGTQEALNKYLELQPTGQFAEAARGMIQYIGGTVETSYGKPKKK